MKQKTLISETLTCPECGHTGPLDDFECGGTPDGVVICERGKRHICWFYVETGKVYDGALEENSEF